MTTINNMMRAWGEKRGERGLRSAQDLSGKITLSILKGERVSIFRSRQSYLSWPFIRVGQLRLLCRRTIYIGECLHMQVVKCFVTYPGLPADKQYSILFYFILFYSILGRVLPLQEAALRQSLPSFSVLCYPCPNRSLLPRNVISPTTFWSSGWSYTLFLPLCASNSPSIIFHSGDVSIPFPFRIGYVLDHVCHSGSLPNDGVTDSVF